MKKHDQAAGPYNIGKGDIFMTTVTLGKTGITVNKNGFGALPIQRITKEEAAKLLFEKGVKIVVVTLGSKGAYLYCKEGGLQIPGFVSKVADTNGAGDSFWGGFLYRISKSGKKPEEFTLNELKEYVRFGNAVASLCVEKKGAIPAMPTLMEVRERMGQ